MSLGLFSVLCGVCLIIWNLVVMLKGWESESWPATLGEIQFVDLKDYLDEYGRHYEVEVRYTYFVDGVKYVSNRVGFGKYLDGIGTSKKTAEQDLAQYEEGSQVKVYYNPRNPKISVLESGHRIGYVSFAGAIILILIGFVFVLNKIE